MIPSSERLAEKVQPSSSILENVLPEVASPVRGGAPQGPDAAISGPLPSASTASAVDRSVLSRQVARPADAGRVLIYRRAGISVRTDCPSVAELRAEGYVTEWIHPHYQSHLMVKEENA